MLARWWPRLALAAVLALAATLRLLWLDREGWGNLYYAATVQSMLTGWKAFFFACYDPECFVSVDKPPLGFWVQAAFAKVLGLSGVSLILPQALAGVASVAVLYALVRRAFGVVAGLLAALALAVMPVSVATDRNNTIDSQVVLVVLLAAAATLRAIATGRLRWLLLAFALVGLGFEIKMLQAYLIVPALVLAYLALARVRPLARIAHLAAAAGVLLAVSLAWPLAVDLTAEDQRPYVGGSEDNSVLQLATGHNGLSRIAAFARGPFGAAAAPGAAIAPRAPAPADAIGPAQGTILAIGPGAGGESGEPGPLRLLNEQLAGQVSWLLPLALIGLAAALRARWRPGPDARAVTLVLLGAWLVTMGAFFSATSGIFHRYYLVMLAPAIAGLAGAGTVELWRAYRERRGPLAAALPVALAATAAVQLAILGPFAEWESRLMPALAIAVVAGLALAVIALAPRLVSVRLVATGAAATAVVMLLAAPIAWAALPVANAPGSMLPAAGPHDRPGPFPSGAVRPGTRAGAQPVPAPGPGRADERLVAYLLAQRGAARWIVATDSAGTASPLMLAAKAPVMALGGFGGGDRIVHAQGFAATVARGELRFVLVGGLAAPPAPGGAIAPGPGAPARPGPAQPRPRELDDPVMTWVRANCAEVPRFAGLYDCAARR